MCRHALFARTGVSDGGLTATERREYGHCVSRAVHASEMHERGRKAKRAGHVNGIKAGRAGDEGRRCKSHSVRGWPAGMFHRKSNFVKTLADTRLY